MGLKNLQNDELGIQRMQFEERDEELELLELEASGYKGRRQNSKAAKIAKPAKSERSRKEKIKVYSIRTSIVLAVFVALYLTAVYSNIPFIEKWRTIYIETAMSTTSHKWLATMFIPASVIDEVMAKKEAELDAQKKLNSSWDDKEVKNPQSVPKKDTKRQEFFEKYWEIDSTSFRNYIDSNPLMTANGYENILIEDLQNTLGLETVKGDPLLVLDAANNTMIIKVSGEGYVGKMAIIKDSSQVELKKSKALGSYGEEAVSYAKTYDSEIVINASGFKDVDGHGSGGIVKGSLVIDGVEYGAPMGSYWKVAGIKQDGKLYVSNYSSAATKEFKWAVEFFPALIINGENVVDGTFGMGIQPRTAIGQTKTGDFLMLVVDGRQVGYSLGCTVRDCSEILAEYNAYQATNLDGGSSSVMIYKGEQITKSSSVSGRGRYMPDAIVVNKVK